MIIIIEIEDLPEVRTGVHILIDYLSVTFPFICYEDEFDTYIADEVVEMIYIFLGFTKEDVFKEEYAQNRYRHQYTIGDYITLRLMGPILKSGHHSCSIELKGKACREFENNSNKTWQEFLEFFIVRLNGSPTRIDLALDDYDGKDIDINYLLQKLDKKYYTTSFKKKYYKLHGCDEEGWSINFGNYNSTQMLVIYEKNKEQLAKGEESFQKYWLRFEMRFFHDKAYNVAFNLLEKDLKIFSYELLKDLLDIKEDNNYSEDNQHKVKSDSRWNQFLNNCSKAKIEKYQEKYTNNLRYRKWLKPHAAFYFLLTLLDCAGNYYDAVTELHENLLVAFKNISEKKIRRLNRFRKEMGLKSIDKEYLIKLEKMAEQIIFDRVTPF